MKKTFLLTGALLAFLFVSCEDNFPEKTTNPDATTPPTATEFTALRTAAYNNLKQEFTFDAGDTYTFISEKGVEVKLYGGCLTKNGAPVTGEVDVEFVELFDRGTMLVNNKPTMGLTSGGDMSLLISGGEFYVNVTQDGVQLETNCGYMISVPVTLTGGEDNDMTSFTGTVNANGEVVWEQAPGEFWIGNNDQTGGEVFYNSFNNEFGWFNCDRFASFTGPMTDIEVIVPEGYDYTNSAIFIAIEGEPNTLGNLYGEYPVGLECYIIFVSADADGNWIYAVKPVTLTADASYTFTEDELNTATEAQVIAAINALP
jgi:hypothetical protein